MAKHLRRTTSDPITKRFRFRLRPGQRLVTPTMTITVPRSKRRRMAGGGLGVDVKVSCECTKAEPNQPDCKPKSVIVGGTATVSCEMSGGCKKCKQTTTITTSGVGTIMV